MSQFVFFLQKRKLNNNIFFIRYNKAQNRYELNGIVNPGIGGYSF
jgi:hypothetical protein